MHPKRRTFKAAAVQMNSTLDQAANLEMATRLVRAAASERADLIVLPEFFACLGPLAECTTAAESLSGPLVRHLSQLAAELHVYLCAGSFAELSPKPPKVYNCSILLAPSGQIVATYRKMHLFDVELAGKVSNRESQFVEPGLGTVVTETEIGTIGQSICYDLRFPELFRRLVSARSEVILCPAAFTLATGRDHWHVLLRARAIENQCYLVAANQVGRHSPTMESYGHSMIVDPWGTIIAEANGSDPAVITAEIDLERVAEIRRQLPALANRRLPAG